MLHPIEKAASELDSASTKSAPSMVISRVGHVATTVAVRPVLRSRAISPNWSPGPSVPTRAHPVTR